MSDLDDRIEAAKAELTRLRLLKKEPHMARLRAAYMANEESVDKISRRFSVSRGQIVRLAKANGWPPRSPVQAKAQQARRDAERQREGA